MEYKFNVTGAERKALVKVISEITGKDSKYLGAPGFAFAVGDFVIDKAGTLSGSSDDSTEMSKICSTLKEHGFVAETSDSAEDTTAVESAVPAEDTASAPESVIDGDKLIIEYPAAGINDTAFANLEQLVANKAALIKKVLGADSLLIERTENTLRFPWFTLSGADGEADAYSRFVAALCETAKTQKRVIAKESDVDSEKFAMRCFLLKLGFIGKELAVARKLLTANLSGNGSFKSGNGKK